MRKSVFALCAAVIAVAFLLGIGLGSLLTKPKPVKKHELPAEVPLPAPAVKPEAAPQPAPVIEPTYPIPPSSIQAKPVSTKPEFQKGMIYVAWTENGYKNPSSGKSVEQLSAMGVNWAGVVTTWYQDRFNTTDIYPLKDKTPADDSLIYAIRKFHENNIKVMLKPHLDLAYGEGKWRGDIDFQNPEDWQKWFDNYSAFILRYAAIAAQEGAELLCIGTELSRSTLTQPEQWRELIREIKEIYKGPLTYAANWSDEFDKIAFWDALDYAGIDPYFPLVTSTNPQVDQLKSAWNDWIAKIEPWQKSINKPVILAEIGYKSAKDATDEPWQHVAVGELDLGLQVNCYQALLESFWDKPWFYGTYWWYWGTNPRMGGPLDRGFTPQNKPAQDVIKEWYGKPVSGKTY